jgi:hypothetical protein
VHQHLPHVLPWHEAQPRHHLDYSCVVQGNDQALDLQAWQSTPGAHCQYTARQHNLSIRKHAGIIISTIPAPHLLCHCSRVHSKVGLCDGGNACPQRITQRGDQVMRNAPRGALPSCLAAHSVSSMWHPVQHLQAM